MLGSDNLIAAERLLIIAIQRVESFVNLKERFEHPDNIAKIEKELADANKQLVFYRKEYLQTLFDEMADDINLKGKVIFKGRFK